MYVRFKTAISRCIAPCEMTGMSVCWTATDFTAVAVAIAGPARRGGVGNPVVLGFDDAITLFSGPSARRHGPTMEHVTQAFVSEAKQLMAPRAQHQQRCPLLHRPRYLSPHTSCSQSRMAALLLQGRLRVHPTGCILRGMHRTARRMHDVHALLALGGSS